MYGKKKLFFFALALMLAIFAGVAVAQGAHGTDAVLSAAGALVGEGVLGKLVATAAAEGTGLTDINETLSALAQESEKKPGVNIGLIIGIVVAVVVVIAVVVVVLLVLRGRKKAPKAPKASKPPKSKGTAKQEEYSARNADVSPVSNSMQDDVDNVDDDDGERTNSIYNSLQMHGAHAGEPSGQFINTMMPPPAAGGEYTTDPYAAKTPDEDKTINPWAKGEIKNLDDMGDEEKTIAPDFAVQVPAFEVHLVVHEKGASNEYTLTMKQGEQVKIGRSKNNKVILSEPYVSREHFEIVAQDEGLMLRNLKAEASAKYTQINGEPFAEQVVNLRSGDVVEIKGDAVSTRLVITQVRVGNQMR